MLGNRSSPSSDVAEELKGMNLSSIEGDPVRFADWAELQVLYSGATGISLESIRTEADIEGLLGEQESSTGTGMPHEKSE